MTPLPARPTLVPRERVGRVRPFDLSDLPGVVQLYERVCGHVDDVQALERYLADIMWSHPWDRDFCPSLVYESGGRIVGCLGVLPRRMVFRGG